LVDESGNLLNHFTYDSFGNLLSQTNTTWLTRYLFTGREWDEAIGLYYYRARYLKDGRFISEDPLKFKSGDFNTYRYVFNNPIHFTDPSGQLSVELQTLLSLSNRISPGTKTQNIRLYDFDSPAYSTALITATNWFYIITEPSQRFKHDNLIGNIPWVLEGKELKNNPGRVSLRPWGASPASLAKVEPKLQFMKDRNQEWPWPQGIKISEIIFPVNGTDDSKGVTCPVAIPQQEPSLPQSQSSQTQNSSNFTFEFPNPFEWIVPIFRLFFPGEERI
jgi:RHS repeat-associated protein